VVTRTLQAMLSRICGKLAVWTLRTGGDSLAAIEDCSGSFMVSA
jgi:hypothetical protein